MRIELGGGVMPSYQPVPVSTVPGPGNTGHQPQPVFIGPGTVFQGYAPPPIVYQQMPPPCPGGVCQPQPQRWRLFR